MKAEDLDRLVEDALHEDAGRARLDAGGWRPTVGGGPRRRFRGFPPMVRRSVVAAVAVAAVIAGVAVPLAILSGLRGEGLTPAESDGGKDLWGRTFDSVSVTEGGHLVGTRIEVTFERREDGGVVRWEDVCNIQGGRVEITADRLLVDDITDSTLIGPCYPIYLGQDDWLQRFFTADPFWQLDGTSLQLVSGQAEIRLEERSDACVRENGRWSHPDCPQALWVRAVIERAGFELTGTEPTAVLGRSRFLDFSMWTTGPDAVSPTEFGGRLLEAGFRHAFSVDGFDVYTDGDRYAWTSPALHVWFRYERLSPSLLDVLQALVETSLDVSYEEIVAG